MEPKTLTRIEKLRLLILGDKQDTSQDDLLNLLVGYAESGFRLLQSQAQKKYGIEKNDTIPADLSYIIEEVVVKRYNRVGSEGFESESVEGHSVTFEAADFDEYAHLIDAYYDDEGVAGKGRWGKVVIY